MPERHSNSSCSLIHLPLWNPPVPCSSHCHGPHWLWLRVLFSVVTVWIISELLNMAKSHLLEPQVTKYKAILNGRSCGYSKSLWECEFTILISAFSKTRGTVLIILQRLGEGGGHEKVAWFTVSSRLPPAIDKASGWFIDFHIPLRPICWCFETFIQSRETQGTWFQLWIIYYPYLGWNGQF